MKRQLTRVNWEEEKYMTMLTDIMKWVSEKDPMVGIWVVFSGE